MRFPDLSEALGDIPYALVGAAATRACMPERATSGLDVAIARGDGHDARMRLREAGLTYHGELAIGGSAWRNQEGFPVDLIELSQPWAAAAIAGAGVNRDRSGQPVMPLAFLVLLKQEAGRAQDIADLSRMLGQADAESLESVRREVLTHMPDAAEDIESLIVLGRREFDATP